MQRDSQSEAHEDIIGSPSDNFSQTVSPLRPFGGWGGGGEERVESVLAENTITVPDPLSKVHPFVYRSKDREQSHFIAI